MLNRTFVGTIDTPRFYKSRDKLWFNGASQDNETVCILWLKVITVIENMTFPLFIPRSVVLKACGQPLVFCTNLTSPLFHARHPWVGQSRSAGSRRAVRRRLHGDGGWMPRALRGGRRLCCDCRVAGGARSLPPSLSGMAYEATGAWSEPRQAGCRLRLAQITERATLGGLLCDGIGLI